MMVLAFFLSSLLLFSSASAATDPLDVRGLEDLYRALRYAPQLTGWKASGGDPCGAQSWMGVSCSGTYVSSIIIHGLGLHGTLGLHFYGLFCLQVLDVSVNHIGGEIPLILPPNATYINLAFNKFTQNIPFSLGLMNTLRHLNISHNRLSGPIGNIFTGLQNLNRMDLSYNNFTGDLPISLISLRNLTGLFLQNNQFTGSILFLENLPLSDLDIRNNHFSGIFPEKLKLIPNLLIEGNLFETEVTCPPPFLAPKTMPNNKNISQAPITEPTSFKSHPSLEESKHTRKRMGCEAIISIVVGGTLLAVCAVILVVLMHLYRKRRLKNFENVNSSFSSLPSTTIRASKDWPEHWSMGSPSQTNPRPIPFVHPTRDDGISRKISFSNKSRISMRVKQYSVAELQAATNFFNEEYRLAESSLGFLYKAEFPDGQILAVKTIKMAALSHHEEGQFLEVIWNIALLRHPNITSLVGYCLQYGQRILVYDYIGTWSLDDALHSPQDPRKPPMWNTRLSISLGIAWALEYLHGICSPPVAHGNIKASNILLNNELKAHLCDCELSFLRQHMASELATICTVGYAAPEYGLPGFDMIKCDIYNFGVLLLELLTGRKPFDSSRARGEQSLTKWASSCLHDYESLEGMVDPAIKGTYSSKGLSRFADIISLCIQPEPKFRPPMSEIADYLVCLIQKTDLTKSSTPRSSTEAASFLKDLSNFEASHDYFLQAG